MKDKKLNNNGFTLIEMIVSVLIVAIMMVGFSAFISISRMTYSEVSTSSKLQEEANVTVNFINELLVEAQDYGWAENVNIYGTDYSVLCIKTLDNTPATSGRDDIIAKFYYFILVDETSGVIRYTKVSCDEDEAQTITFTDAESSIGAGYDKRVVSGISEELFSDTLRLDNDKKYCFIADSLDVSDAIDISQSIDKNGRRIKIVLKFLYNGEEYVATVNNFLRNKLKF